MSVLIRTSRYSARSAPSRAAPRPASNPPASAPQTPPTANRPSTTAPSGPVEVNDSRRGQIPVGQELDVRLQTSLSSETATV